MRRRRPPRLLLLLLAATGGRAPLAGLLVCLHRLGALGSAAARRRFPLLCRRSSSGGSGLLGLPPLLQLRIQRFLRCRGGAQQGGVCLSKDVDVASHLGGTGEQGSRGAEARAGDS